MGSLRARQRVDGTVRRPIVRRRPNGWSEPQPLIVTEHRAHGCRCAACGTQTRAAFPQGVAAPVQYGKRINAMVLYLLHYQLLPEKRLSVTCQGPPSRQLPGQ
jgi:transposase